MKKMNDKGFSLVELIIVIAIMAILIAVLAPQYLRYVEKSRLQADNSAVGEIANAAKVAVANDAINKEIPTAGANISIPNSTASAVAVTGASGSLLQTEIDNVIGSNVLLKSNAYKSTAPTISVTIDSAGVATVTASNYINEVGATATAITF